MLRLIKKLEGKYSPVIKLDLSGYAMVNDDIIQAIGRPRAAQSGVHETTKFNVSIDITQGELSMVQTFLWSLGQKLSQESLGFQQIGDRADVKRIIKVNFYDGHLAIVQSALSLLTDEPTDRTKTIAEYPLRYLPKHLEALQYATGDDALTEDEKIEIGSGVYNLVYTDVLEKHRKRCGDISWFGDANDVTVLRRWLNDDVAISKLGQRDREWLGDIERTSNPNRALLENIMKKVALYWLQDVEGDASKPFKCLQDYLAMVSDDAVISKGELAGKFYRRLFTGK
ncbi:nacht and tpr domain containing protein [Colletotrichum sp. SAR11_59]|nr:nacht and tpr domain containing protein [Colletotrichum sp. SAR11_59]